MPPEPDFPLGPDDLSRLEEMMRSAEQVPDMMSTAIETMAGIYARWYRALQAAGVPEPRAAQWVSVMVAAPFQSAP